MKKYKIYDISELRDIVMSGKCTDSFFYKSVGAKEGEYYDYR